MTTKRKSRRPSAHPQNIKPHMSLPVDMTSNTINTDPVKRAIAIPLESEQPSPKPPSIFPMCDSTTLQASPASTPSPDEDASAPPPPPPTPFPWVWRCHSCATAYRMSCTRRCLLCSHRLCSTTLAGDIVSSGSSGNISSGRPAKRRRRSHRGGPCNTEFDYLGWATWGSWRRERHGGDDAFAMFEAVFVPDHEGGGAAVVWDERAPDQTERVERRKREMYASGTHDCSLHCDYPSECHNSIYSAAREKAQLAQQEANSNSEENEAEDVTFQVTINDVIESAISEDGSDEDTIFDYVVPWYAPDETSNDEAAPVEIDVEEIDVEDVYELYAGSGTEDDVSSDESATPSAAVTGIVVTTTISSESCPADSFSAASGLTSSAATSSPIQAPVWIPGLGMFPRLANESAHPTDSKEQSGDPIKEAEESDLELGADGGVRDGRVGERDALAAIPERDGEGLDILEEELTSSGVEGVARNELGEGGNLADLVRLNNAFMRGEL